MAFSTQKDFFNVPFLTESYELGCKKACVKLKSYESTEDARAWASDETKQSKFLSDLVTCEYPVGKGAGDFSSAERQLALTGSPNADADAKTKEIPADEVEIMIGGDSLLQCANVHLDEYRKLLKINTVLEKQLKVSSEQLKTVEQEYKKIVENLANRVDTNTAKDFYKKIQEFTTAGKFNKNEENEMLQIYQKIKNMNEAHEALQAENNYFRRLVEKLTLRAQLENITLQPEQSQDIGYLQKEIDSLRKECLLLRQFEEDYQISKQDAENIKVIMKERNRLREKCKSLRALEQRVEQLDYETQAAKKEAKDLDSDLGSKLQYINTIENEMQNMQKFFEKKEQEAYLREENLKAQLNDLKNEFVKAKCEAHKADMLTVDVSCLRNELLKKDLALYEYDCQYKQLMDVINELQSVKLQSLHDNQTQTCREQTDELAFYTCATLEEILKELKRRGCLDNKLLKVHAPDYMNQDENEAHCCAEMESLKQQLNEMKNRMREDANCEEICKDALERLKELEIQNSQLLHDNQDLNAKLIEGEAKLAEMLRKLEKLHEDINKNGQEAISIGKGLEENIALVKNISDVQLKNQQLANAVSAINSRDDQKIIDDLHRQLEEELAKLRKCQQDNAYLLEEVKQRETALKELKELNNKLIAENNKLKSNAETKIDNKIDITKYKENPASNYQISSKTSQIKDKQPTNLGKNKELEKEDYEKKKPATPDLPSSKQRPISVDQQKLLDVTDSDDFATSSASKETTRKQRKESEQPLLRRDTDKIKTSGAHTSSPSKNVSTRQHDAKNDSTLDDFVNKKSDSLKFNLQKGQCFEKEFRKILEEFILECSNYFCRLFNAKSRLYIISHKLCHNGIDILNFQELAYIHRKIYNQADKLLPGCMLDMILTEHREQVESILTSVIMPRLIRNRKLNLKTSDGNVCNDGQKCCCCKNELCCNNSEEMLKNKVSKLEKDIGIAREYLESLRSIPLDDSLSIDNDNSTDTNNSTYRASSPNPKQQRLYYTKHVKNLKARAKQQIVN